MTNVKNISIGLLIAALSVSISGQAATISDAKNIVDNALEKTVLIDSEPIKAIIKEKMNKGLDAHVQALQTMLEKSKESLLSGNKSSFLSEKTSGLLEKVGIGLGKITGYASGLFSVMMSGVGAYNVNYLYNKYWGYKTYVASAPISFRAYVAEYVTEGCFRDMTAIKDSLRLTGYAGALSIVTFALLKKYCNYRDNSVAKNKIETQNIKILAELLTFLTDEKTRAAQRENERVLSEKRVAKWENEQALSAENEQCAADAACMSVVDHARSLFFQDLKAHNGSDQSTN